MKHLAFVVIAFTAFSVESFAQCENTREDFNNRIKRFERLQEGRGQDHWNEKDYTKNRRDKIAAYAQDARQRIENCNAQTDEANKQGRIDSAQQKYEKRVKQATDLAKRSKDQIRDNALKEFKETQKLLSEGKITAQEAEERDIATANKKTAALEEVDKQLEQNIAKAQQMYDDEVKKIAEGGSESEPAERRPASGRQVRGE